MHRSCSMFYSISTVSARIGGYTTAKKELRQLVAFIFLCLLQLFKDVTAPPLFGFEFDTPLFEFRHEQPTLDPLFELPTTTGSLQYLLSSPPQRRGGRLAAARFRFFTLCGLTAAQGAISVRRPTFHRVSYQPGHRKRQRRRGSGANPTHRCASPDTNSRHSPRGPNYPPRRG